MNGISIGYHTRLHGQNSVKVCGGSFGGQFDTDTVNRLVKHHFTVVTKPSGTLVFVDREGREVTLYVTVDPGTTDAGKIARTEYNRVVAARQQEQENKRQQLEDILSDMSVDEALERLQAPQNKENR